MKESSFGFEYSWQDLKPMRALAMVVFGTQITGCLLGLAFPLFPRLLPSAWFGGAIATFPAFLLGLLVQAHLTPGRIGEHKVMVRRMGLIAFLLTVAAIALPLLGFGR